MGLLKEMRWPGESVYREKRSEDKILRALSFKSTLKGQVEEAEHPERTKN